MKEELENINRSESLSEGGVVPRLTPNDVKNTIAEFLKHTESVQFHSYGIDCSFLTDLGYIETTNEGVTISSDLVSGNRCISLISESVDGYKIMRSENGVTLYYAI